jgi:hypothetical protein
MSEVRWSPVDQDDVFTQRIRERWTEQLGRRLDILVAGCGRDSPGTFPSVAADRFDCRIVRVDEELPQLNAHAASRRDLDSWCVGDKRTEPQQPRSHDVAYVNFLLERIQHAELVLDRIVSALRPGGLLLIKLRDRRTAYGFCDRMTPGWLRRLVWKSFVPAGSVGPLPAIYESVATREGIHAYCLMRGLVIADDLVTTSGPARIGPHERLVGLVCRMVERLSGRRLTAAHDQVTLVVRKPQNHFARLI